LGLLKERAKVYIKSVEDKLGLPAKEAISDADILQ